MINKNYFHISCWWSKRIWSRCWSEIRFWIWLLLWNYFFIILHILWLLCLIIWQILIVLNVRLSSSVYISLFLFRLMLRIRSVYHSRIVKLIPLIKIIWISCISIMKTFVVLLLLFIKIRLRSRMRYHLWLPSHMWSNLSLVLYLICCIILFLTSYFSRLTIIYC